MLKRRLFAAFLLGLTASPLRAQVPSAVPLDAQLQAPPALMTGADGRSYLAFELLLSDVDGKHRAMTLDRLVVRNSENEQELGHVSGDAAWTGMRAAFSLAAPDDNAAVIGPAQRGVFFWWVPLTTASLPIKNVEAEITLRLAGVARLLKLRCCSATVRQPVTVDAPLSGNGWIAANGPSDSSDHRRSLMAVDGRLQLGQRFAIDWIKTDSSGKVASGAGKRNRDFVSYGARVLAVADGLVADVLDGVPENSPGEERAIKIDYGNIGGNCVILDLGNSIYAGYAHLQPGSIVVKRGQLVKRGDVLGLLGNSGNSDAPHLHFQMMSSASLVASEGIPFAFARFDTAGIADEDMRVRGEPIAHHERVTPLENMVINFP